MRHRERGRVRTRLLCGAKGAACAYCPDEQALLTIRRIAVR
ncbi:hypothetical protein KPATCC21470_4889 [Kitasatospora purpeofusca]